MLNDSDFFFLFEDLCFIGAILHINILSIFTSPPSSNNTVYPLKHQLVAACLI